MHFIIFYFISNAEKFNDVFIKLFNRDLILINRTIIWEKCFEVILDKTFLGYRFFNVCNPLGNYIRYNIIGVVAMFSGDLLSRFYKLE